MELNRNEKLERSLFALEVDFSDFNENAKNLNDVTKLQLLNFAENLIDLAGRIIKIATPTTLNVSH